MTYFVRDDIGPWDAAAEREHTAWRNAMILDKTHGKEVGCLFEGEHDPRHPADMPFHVSMDDQGVWEDLTEAEMMERYKNGATGALLSSQWDFWWE